MRQSNSAQIQGTRTAPALYKRVLAKLRKEHFLDSNGTNVNNLLRLVHEVLEQFQNNAGDGPYYGQTPKENTDEEVRSRELLPDHESEDLSSIASLFPSICNGAVRGNHPLMMKNIIPAPTIASLVSQFISSSMMANLVSTDDSGGFGELERSCVRTISELADYPLDAAGMFTFGGTATNIYAMKLGTCKAQPTFRKQGLRKKIALFTAKASHYSHETAASWTGIGSAHLIKIPTDSHQRISIDNLRTAIITAHNEGYAIGGIFASGGTTSCLGIDPIQDICKLRDEIVQELSLDYTPHVHVDAVLGWAFLTYTDYDFEANELDLPLASLASIRDISTRIKEVKYADSFGVDFHKTGYTPYNSTIFICKNGADLSLISRKPGSTPPLFHNSDDYNPGVFTIETTRPTSVIAAVWGTLQSLGKRGLQVLLANAIEMSLTAKEQIKKNRYPSTSSKWTLSFSRCLYRHLS